MIHHRRTAFGIQLEFIPGPCWRSRKPQFSDIAFNLGKQCHRSFAILVIRHRLRRGIFEGDAEVHCDAKLELRHREE